LRLGDLVDHRTETSQWSQRRIRNHRRNQHRQQRPGRAQGGSVLCPLRRGETHTQLRECGLRRVQLCLGTGKRQLGLGVVDSGKFVTGVDVLTGAHRDGHHR
jgi:hypothetical protein